MRKSKVETPSTLVILRAIWYLVSFLHNAKIDPKIAASSQPMYIMGMWAAYPYISHISSARARVRPPHCTTSAIIYDFIAFDALPIIKLLNSNHMLHLYCVYTYSLVAAIFTGRRISVCFHLLLHPASFRVPFYECCIKHFCTYIYIWAQWSAICCPYR